MSPPGCIAGIRSESVMCGAGESTRRTRSYEISPKVLTASGPSATWRQVARLRWIRVKVRDVKSQGKRST